MTTFEQYSIMLTLVYDVLTFGLLIVVVYETFIKHKFPKVYVSLEPKPYKFIDYETNYRPIDLIIYNKNVELVNVKITSTPDTIGWMKIGKNQGLKTSEYLKRRIGFINKNERISLFWCDLSENNLAWSTSITFNIEYEFFFYFIKLKGKKDYNFDLMAYRDVIGGIADLSDINQLTEEIRKFRDEITTMSLQEKD